MKYHNRLLITLILTIVLHNQTFASDFQILGLLKNVHALNFLFISN